VDAGEWLEMSLEHVVVQVIQEVVEAVLIVEVVVAVLVVELVLVEVELVD